MENWNKEERRQNNRLHEDDISLIVSGVTGSLSDHYCRFSAIKTEEMTQVIPFMLSFKRLSEKIGSVVLYVIVTVLSGGFVAIFAKGLWEKIKGE